MCRASIPPLAKRQRLDDTAAQGQQPPVAPRLSTRRDNSHAESPSGSGGDSSQRDEDAEDLERETDVVHGRARRHETSAGFGAAGRPRRHSGQSPWDPAITARRNSDGAMAATADVDMEVRRHDSGRPGGVLAPSDRVGLLESGRRIGQDSSEQGGGGGDFRAARSAPVSRRRSLEDGAVVPRSATEPADSLLASAQLVGPQPTQDASAAPQAMVPWKTLETLLQEAAAASFPVGGPPAAGRDLDLSPAPGVAPHDSSRPQLDCVANAAKTEAGLAAEGFPSLGAGPQWDEATGRGVKSAVAAELQDRLRSSAGASGPSIARQPGSGGGSGVLIAL